MRRSVFIIAVILFAQYSFGQSQPAIREIGLSKVSRGFEQDIRITPDSVNVISIDHKGSGKNTNFGRKITREEWIELVSTMQQVKLSDISKLTSPTLGRASDAAVHSTLKVKDKSNEYTHGFDNDNPNIALKPLLDCVKKIAGVKEE